VGKNTGVGNWVRNTGALVQIQGCRQVCIRRRMVRFVEANTCKCIGSCVLNTGM
jgi:hypothetical protein